MTRYLLASLFVLASCANDAPMMMVSGNELPIANAGAGSTEVAGTVVMLDGSASSDPDGTVATYLWTLVERPVNSTTNVGMFSSAIASCRLDVPGSYSFELTVTDNARGRATSSVTFVAREPTIAVDAGDDQAVALQATVQLTGSVDAEVVAAPQWTLVGTPANSQATLVDPTSLTPSFVADREGSYTVRLTASTPFSTVADDVTVNAVVPRQVLDYVLVDAEYSTALDRFVIVSDLPATLRLHDPATGTEQTLALPESPVAVALSADGLRAVVGYPSKISIVDLQTRTITATHTVPRSVYDLVLDGTRVHVFHAQSINSEPVVTVNLTNGSITEGAYISGASHARLQPGTSVVYVGNTTISPAEIFRFEVVAGALEETRESPYHGDYGMSGGMWFKSDGSVVVTRAGTVFRATADAMLDLTYVGSFGDTNKSAFDWVAHSAVLERFVALRSHYDVGSTPTNHYVQIHDEQYTKLSARELPDTPIGTTFYKSVPRFAAFDAASTKVHVIARAGTAVGAPHALYTLDP